MSYITKQDLLDAVGEERLMQLTDDDRSGVINDAVVGKAIAYAESTFETYARRRYSLPVLATVKVKSVCIDLAVNWLDRRRASGVEALKMVQDSYKEIERYLKDVSSGAAALDVPASEETKEKPASGDRVLSGPAKPATFSDDKLRGF
jgi:phage gp36-like protein